MCSLGLQKAGCMLFTTLYTHCLLTNWKFCYGWPNTVKDKHKVEAGGIPVTHVPIRFGTPVTQGIRDSL